MLANYKVIYMSKKKSTRGSHFYEFWGTIATLHIFESPLCKYITIFKALAYYRTKIIPPYFMQSFSSIGIERRYPYGCAFNYFSTFFHLLAPLLGLLKLYTMLTFKYLHNYTNHLVGLWDNRSKHLVHTFMEHAKKENSTFHH